MMEQHQQHTAAVVASTAAAAVPELKPAPNFSFSDEPLFAIEDDTILAANASASVIGTSDDFFSSPEWTDPSPALTMSMSFNTDSCDTSPLLTDMPDVPELTGMPLFGYSSFSHDASNKEEGVAPKRSPEMAFSRAKGAKDNATMLLMRAFNNNVMASASGAIANDAVETASPSAILSPLPTTHSAPESVKASSTRGTKRRHVDTTDLLPLDAPIQPRSYTAPSATSRKASSGAASVVEEAYPETPDMSGLDPLSAKRLSNTLAARRSRHRKAEELKQLNDHIDELSEQVEMWKRRCLRAEQERDHALGSVST